MGRRHLSRAAAYAALVALVLAAPAAASLRWQVASRGVAHGFTGEQVGYVAVVRSAAKSFTAKIDPTGVAALDKVDFSRLAVVAVFGPYGCADSRIDVTSVAQHDSTLAVTLVEHEPKPGSVQCMAIFETYRLLEVSKAGLQKPYPTRVQVTLART